MDAPRYRVFQGKDTRQVEPNGKKPRPREWFYEPVDYEGDTLWSYGYSSKEEAMKAAEAHSAWEW